MSTILKALKKLEEQSPTPSDAPRPQVRRRRVPSAAATFTLPGVVWVLAVTALIAVLAIFGWSRWQDPGEIVPADTRRPVASPAPSSAATSAQPDTAAAPPQSIPALPQDPPPAVTPDGTPILKPPSQPQPIPADPAVADVAQPPPAAPTRPVGNDPGPNRPTVIIQAIAWSTVPASRIAVINGHVLHEGDGLGSIRVSRIDKNHVTLTEKGRSWSVKFGR